VFDFSKRLYDDYDGEIDWDRIDELIDEFLDSPEGKPFEQEGVAYIAMMFEYALRHVGAEPAKMTARDMEEVLFQLFPEKVSMEASEAPHVIAELRAFWQFLGRQYQLKHAGAIVALLDDRAEARLRRELADPANFGMAKSFVMMGEQAGFDMTTEEGMQAWMNYYNTKMLGMPPGPPPSTPFVERLPPDAELYAIDDEEEETPAPSGPTPKQRSEARAKKRKARKAQKKSRKRNR
jgi:hypothetical protein